MVSSWMLRSVALVRTDVLEEPSASFIRMTRIGELETTLAATSNRRTLRRNTKYSVPANAPLRTRWLPSWTVCRSTHKLRSSSLIQEVLSGISGFRVVGCGAVRRDVSGEPQDSHGAISQKMTFFQKCCGHTKAHSCPFQVDGSLRSKRLTHVIIRFIMSVWCFRRTPKVLPTLTVQREHKAMM
jgi:hypothetical protein